MLRMILGFSYALVSLKAFPKCKLLFPGVQSAPSWDTGEGLGDIICKAFLVWRCRRSRCRRSRTRMVRVVLFSWFKLMREFLFPTGLLVLTDTGPLDLAIFDAARVAVVVENAVLRHVPVVHLNILLRLVNAVVVGTSKRLIPFSAMWIPCALLLGVWVPVQGFLFWCMPQAGGR